MPNYYLITLPSRMLFAQAQAQLDAVQEALNTGTVQAQYELLGLSAAAYNAFYTNLGQPLLRAMPFSGLPIAQDWNAFQATLVHDFTILYAQSLNLASAATNGLAYSTVEDALLSDSVDALAAKIAAFPARKPTSIGLQQYVISDTFTDTSKLDVALTSAALENGAVLLPSTSQVDFTPKVSLTIDDDFIRAVLGQSAGAGASNGFPGTLHEVTITENTNTLTDLGSEQAVTQAVQLNADPGQAIAFVGDQGLHADLRALTDNDPSTWFEYEVCNIPDTIKYSPCLGYGFAIMVPGSGSALRQAPWYAFHDGTVPAPAAFFPPPPTTANPPPLTPDLTANGSYPTLTGTVDPSTNPATLSAASFTFAAGGAPAQGGVLRLVLVGTFAQAVRMTEVRITPNVLNNKRPVVREVAVRASDSAQWIQAAPASAYSNPGLIAAAQLSAPITGAEVWAMPETDVAFVRIVIEQPQSYLTKIGHLVWIDQRVPQPSSTQALDQALGQSVLAQTDVQARTDGPNVSLPMVISGAATVRNAIESITAYQDGSQALIGPLIEAFDGWRYAIALTDVSFLAHGYADTAVLATQSFTAPIDIKSIALRTAELIPDLGDPTYPWFTYEVSLDNGATWTSIAPLTAVRSSAPRTLSVNPPGVTSNAVTTTGYDPQSNPATAVRLRVTLARGGDTSLTPRLLGYNLVLQGTPV